MIFRTLSDSIQEEIIIQELMSLVVGKEASPHLGVSLSLLPKQRTQPKPRDLCHLPFQFHILITIRVASTLYIRTKLWLGARISNQILK